MKKMVISIASLLSAFSFTSALAAINSPVTIINNSKLQMTVNYSLCDAQKKMCTLIKENIIHSAQSGKNHLSIITQLQPKLDNLTLVTATARDSSGKQIATLQNACNLPEKSNTIILDNNGTSQITCQYR